MATKKFKAEYTTFAYDETTKAFVPHKGSFTEFNSNGFQGALDSIIKDNTTGLVSVTITALAPDHNNNGK